MKVIDYLCKEAGISRRKLLYKFIKMGIPYNTIRKLKSMVLYETPIKPQVKILFSITFLA